MKKYIINNLIFIFIILLVLGISIKNTKAFLDWDIWLNLYKNLEKSMKDFKEQVYIYELGGQDKENISENINRILEKKWIWKCLVDWISSEDITQISNWNIKILVKNIKQECKWENQELNNQTIWLIVSGISDIKYYYKNTAKNKVKTIHNISKIWMYSDWNLDNSPFDLIKDLQDIDKIIFTEEIEYVWENIDFLNTSRNNPFISPIWHNIDDIISKNENLRRNLQNDNLNIIDSGLIEDSIILTWDSNLSLNPNFGWHNYICPVDSNKSWLSDESMNSLVMSIANNPEWDSFEYSSLWHIKLPISNKISPLSLTWNNISQMLLSNFSSNYSRINDNNLWPCNSFICIKIDFVVRKQNALAYSVSKSIENILEVSNKHLKKATNTSLVQSKMTTNNFEMSLRDLNLPDMFHMWYQISFKSPPILNLENLAGFGKDKQASPQAEENKQNHKIHILLSNKYKIFWLDYSDPNNLNNFKQKDKELKSIINSLSLTSIRAWDLRKQASQIQKLNNKIISFNQSNISSKINNKILEDFNRQFTELEQFTLNILNYVNNLDIMIKNLNEIKTYSW